MVLRLWNTTHRQLLRKWLRYARVIIGFNLPYDIVNLRADPEFRPLLDGSHLLIDGQILRFMWRDTLAEGSLKDIGPILGRYVYDRTLRDGRFKSPLDPAAEHYAAEDSHNTILACAELARRIEADYQTSPSVLNPSGEVGKLHPHTLVFWSSILWSAVQLIEAGIPLSMPRLNALSTRLQEEIADSEQRAAALGIPLKVPGPKGVDDVRQDFMNSCAKLVDDEAPVEKLLGESTVLNHPLCALTDKKGKISQNAANRKLFQTLLEAAPAQERCGGAIAGLKAWNDHTDAYGTYSKYVAPLLTGKLNEKSKSPYDCLAIGTTFDPLVRLTFPRVYVVPGSASKFTDEQRGQKQGRISITDPQVQQWTPEMKACLQSRYPGGSIVSWDLSQLELRVPTLLSGDPGMMDAFARGLDLHGDRAIFIFGPSIVDDPDWKCGDMKRDPRQWCKKFNFEDLYLAGPEKMQAVLFKDAGKIFPLSFFKDVVATREKLRPGLCEWQRQLLRDAKRDGFLILPITGHSRIFSDPYAFMNEVVNFPVQCTGAVIMSELQSTTIELCRGTPIVPFLNWHDALFADCPHSWVPTYRAIIHEAFTRLTTRGHWARLCNLYNRSVPLKYEVKELA